MNIIVVKDPPFGKWSLWQNRFCSTIKIGSAFVCGDFAQTEGQNHWLGLNCGIV